MAITLLGKYHAYAPPFKYMPPTGPAYIGGVEGRIEWNDDLGNRLLLAWNRAHAELITKRWRIPSKTRVGVMYDVIKILGEFVCSCPARGNCWHIDVAARLDLDEDCDIVDGKPRTFEEHYGIEAKS